MGNEAKESHPSSETVQDVPKYESNIGLPTRKLQKKRSDVELPKLEKFEPRARKAPLGDKITALQQLVSPFGKADTASVLLEAIVYIKFLLNQVEVLSTNEHGGSVRLAENTGYGSLRSRGLCLVSKDNFANFPLPLAKPILKYETPDSRKDENMQNQAKCAPFTSTTFSDETKLLEAEDDGKNKPTNGLNDEITVLQQVSSPSSKVNGESLSLTPSKPVCDSVAIDIRPVINYAPELEDTYLGKTVATDRIMTSFRALPLITVQLVMLVLLYLRSGTSVMDSPLLKLLKAYAISGLDNP